MDTWTTLSKTQGRRRPFSVCYDVVVKEPLLFWKRGTTAQRNLNSWSCTQPCRSGNCCTSLVAGSHVNDRYFLGSLAFQLKHFATEFGEESRSKRQYDCPLTLVCSQTESARDSCHRPSRCPVLFHTSRWSWTGALQRQSCSDTHRFLNHRLGHLSADVGSRLVHLNGNPGSRRRHKCARPNHHTCRWFCILSAWRLDAQDCVAMVLDQKWLTVLCVTTRVRNHVLGTRVPSHSLAIGVQVPRVAKSSERCGVLSLRRFRLFAERTRLSPG